MELRYGSRELERICTDERRMQREQWSARLTANWRLIVQEEPEGKVTALVLEIVDYHKK